jgi:hypothetical protein
MWDALIQGAHLQSHSDLLRVCIFLLGVDWVSDLMLKTLFELPVILFQSIKVVVEREH